MYTSFAVLQTCCSAACTRLMSHTPEGHCNTLMPCRVYTSRLKSGTYTHTTHTCTWGCTASHCYNVGCTATCIKHVWTCAATHCVNVVLQHTVSMLCCNTLCQCCVAPHCFNVVLQYTVSILCYNTLCQCCVATHRFNVVLHHIVSMLCCTTLFQRNTFRLMSATHCGAPCNTMHHTVTLSHTLLHCPMYKSCYMSSPFKYTCKCIYRYMFIATCRNTYV